MKVGFTGTQEGLTERQQSSLQSYLIEHVWCLSTRSEYHHGDCIGADKAFHEMVWNGFEKVVIHPPTDSRKRAFCQGRNVTVREPKEYLERDDDIAREVDVLIACPKGHAEELRSGTWATVRYARKYNKRVIIIYPDGSTGSGNSH